MLLSSILSVIVSNFFLPMHISIFVGVILLLVILLLLVIEHNKEKREETDKEIFDLKNNLKDLKNKLQEANRKSKELQNISIESTRGNRLFLMAISQDLCNPLFIGILKKAVFEENNILAGYLLGNIYYSGLEFNGKDVIKCDYNMAADVYQAINENDNYGVSDWMLGWLYQLNLIDDAHLKADDENMSIARGYYERSQKKGYPKALNSLANLMINKRAGFNEGDEIKAISLYHEAADLEDNYAILNCGHYYKNQKKNYNVALKYYSQSAGFSCPEGSVNVGEVFEKLSSTNVDTNNEYIIDACRNYLNCIKFGEFFSSKNQKRKFVAKAYYKLGNIINSRGVLDDETKIFFGNRNIRDVGPYCLSKAYDILSEIIDALPTDGNEEFIEIHKNLNNMYHNSP